MFAYYSTIFFDLFTLPESLQLIVCNGTKVYIYILIGFGYANTKTTLETTFEGRKTYINK